MMVLALSTKYFRTSYFQNCTFSEWTNQFLHIIGLENAKLDIFVPTQVQVVLLRIILRYHFFYIFYYFAKLINKSSASFCRYAL